jgi:hypothetical protein
VAVQVILALISAGLGEGGKGEKPLDGDHEDFGGR